MPSQRANKGPEHIYLRNFIEVATDQFLLLDKLDVLQRFGRQFDSLVESVLAAIRHIDQFDNFGL